MTDRQRWVFSKHVKPQLESITEEDIGGYTEDMRLPYLVYLDLLQRYLVDPTDSAPFLPLKAECGLFGVKPEAVEPLLQDERQKARKPIRKGRIHRVHKMRVVAANKPTYNSNDELPLPPVLICRPRPQTSICRNEQVQVPSTARPFCTF